MARSTSPSSSEIDTKVDIWSQVPDSREEGPSVNMSTILQPQVDHSSGTPQRIKRSCSTEESPVDKISLRSSEKRARENDDQDRLNNRPLKTKNPSSQSPQPRKPSKTQSPRPSGPSKSSQIDQTDTSKNEDSDSQSLGNLTCAICLSAPSPAVVTKCGHVTCGECLASSIVSQNNSSFGALPSFFQPVGHQINNGKCPVCRASLIGGWGTAMRGVILKMGKTS